MLLAVGVGDEIKRGEREQQRRDNRAEAVFQKRLDQQIRGHRRQRLEQDAGEPGHEVRVLSGPIKRKIEDGIDRDRADASQRGELQGPGLVRLLDRLRQDHGIHMEKPFIDQKKGRQKVQPEYQAHYSLIDPSFVDAHLLCLNCRLQTGGSFPCPALCRRKSYRQKNFSLTANSRNNC